MSNRKVKEKLKHVLLKKYKGGEILWERAGDRIVGELIWKGFVGMDQVERQEKLWDYLHKQLDQEEEMQIAAILTATPYEVPAALTAKRN